jgi:hypothetical protein
VELDGNPYRVYATPQGELAYKCEEVDPLVSRLGSGSRLNYGDFPSTIESVISLDNWVNGLSPTRLEASENTYWTSLGVDARRPQQMIVQPKATVAGGIGSNKPVRQIDFAGFALLAAGGILYKLVAGAWSALYTVPGTTNTITDMVLFNGSLVLCGVGTTTDTNSGATVSYGAATLTDTAKAWTTNQWAGRVVNITNGQVNVVLSNTATVLTMSANWATQPPNTTLYTIDTHWATVTTPDAVTFTQMVYAGTNADAPKADLVVAIRSQIWKAVKPNKIYSATDPTLGSSWTSTATLIGESSKKITGLAPYQVDIAIAKEDGLWSVDRSGNDFQIAPELRSVSDPNNGMNLKVWRLGLMLRVRNGLWRYEGGRLTWVGLDRYRGVGVDGSASTATHAVQVIDLAPYLNELFVVMQPAGSNTAIYLGSFQEFPWRWHMVWYQTGFVPTYCALSANAFGNPTLFIGRNNAGAYDTVYLNLPQATDNPLDDTAYQYDNAGSAVLTTVEYAPLPDQDKFWTKVVVHALSAGAGGTVQVGYLVDPTADPATLTFTPMVGPQGQTSQASTQTYQEWFFGNPPASVGAPAQVVGKSIMFQVTLSTTTATTTPIVKHIVCHYKHRPQPRQRWELQLICEDRVAGERHYVDRRTADQQLLDLRLTRLASPPTKFQDMTGTIYDVVVEKVSHRLLERVADRRRYVATVVLLEHLGTAVPALPPKTSA